MAETIATTTDAAIAPQPTSVAEFTTVIDHTAYPHIIDLIIQHASYNVLLQIRLTSHHMHELVQRLLFSHIKIGNYESLYSPVYSSTKGGDPLRLPWGERSHDYTPTPAECVVLAHTRICDIDRLPSKSLWQFCATLVSLELVRYDPVIEHLGDGTSVTIFDGDGLSETLELRTKTLVVDARICGPHYEQIVQACERCVLHVSWLCQFPLKVERERYEEEGEFVDKDVHGTSNIEGLKEVVLVFRDGPEESDMDRKEGIIRRIDVRYWAAMLKWLGLQSLPVTIVGLDELPSSAFATNVAKRKRSQKDAKPSARLRADLVARRGGEVDFLKCMTWEEYAAQPGVNPLELDLPEMYLPDCDKL